MGLTSLLGLRPGEGWPGPPGRPFPDPHPWQLQAPHGTGQAGGPSCGRGEGAEHRCLCRRPETPESASPPAPYRVCLESEARPPRSSSVRGACGERPPHAPRPWRMRLSGHEAAPWLTRLPTPFRFVQRQEKPPRAPLPPRGRQGSLSVWKDAESRPPARVWEPCPPAPQSSRNVFGARDEAGLLGLSPGGEPCARQAWGFGTVAHRQPGSLFPSSHMPVVSVRVLEPTPQQWPLLSPPVALFAPQGLCWVPFPSRKPVCLVASRALEPSAAAFCTCIRTGSRAHTLTRTHRPHASTHGPPFGSGSVCPSLVRWRVPVRLCPTLSRVHGAVALVMSASVPAAHVGFCPPPTPVALRTPWHIMEE